MKNYLYNIDFKKMKENYDAGDIFLLTYLEEFIPDNLKELYDKVLDYNSIFGYGKTIADCYEQARKEKDEKFKKALDKFVVIYDIPKNKLDEFDEYQEEYLELRESLLDELNIDTSIFRKDIKDISKYGDSYSELITPLNEIESDKSYTIARKMNYCYCIELHCNNDKATIEYSYRTKPDEWNVEIEKADWFNKSMDIEDIWNKLEDLFKAHFEISEDNKKKEGVEDGQAM